jgi:hypothetical protein
VVVVALVHDVVAQAVMPLRVLGVGFSLAKLVPSTVTTVPADGGPLKGSRTEITGASNENTVSREPMMLVIVTPSESDAPKPAAGSQESDVAEAHVIVPQTYAPNLTVGVRSGPPKFKPVTVTLDPTEAATFVGYI